MTFSELCDLYFAEGVANKKPSTLRSDRTRARLHLVPLLGSKRVEVLTRDDIEQMRAAVESGRSIARGPEKRGPGSVAKGGPGAAAQCVEASTSRRFGRSSAFFRPRSSGASPTRCRRDRADECCARGRGDLAARVHRLPTRRDRHPEMGGSRPRTPFPEFARFEDRQEDRPPERTCGRILRTLPRIVGNRLSSPAAARDGQTARSTRHGRACASAPGSRTCGFTICGTLSRRLELRLPSACRSSQLLGHKHASTTARYAHLADDPARRANDAIGATIAAAFRS